MRRSFQVVTIVIVIFLTYYFFIRSFEYKVKFKARTLPGDLIETIRIWNRTLTMPENTNVKSFVSLKQLITKDGRQYIYNWEFDAVNDSLTHVKIKITEPKRRFVNKVLVPFVEQPIEKDAKELANTFYKILNEHLEITSVEIMGEALIDSAFCVCRRLKTDQIDKANGMMKYYGLLTSFIDNHSLKPKGPPMVRVNEWNHELGTLEFDFCFPIEVTDSLPVSDSIAYRSFGQLRALKAKYTGNFITSDRAWYSLVYYANLKGYTIRMSPIEYFHSNPNLGMNEVDWKADIYLPINTD
jgi:hypothetical protein